MRRRLAAAAHHCMHDLLPCGAIAAGVVPARREQQGRGACVAARVAAAAAVRGRRCSGVQARAPGGVSSPRCGSSFAGTSSGRCREGGPARRAGGAVGEQAQGVVAHHVAAPGPSDGPPGGPTAARIAPERSGCRACAAAAGPARCRCLLDAVQHCWRRCKLRYAGKPIAPPPVRAAALACAAHAGGASDCNQGRVDASATRGEAQRAPPTLNLRCSAWGPPGPCRFPAKRCGAALQDDAPRARN